MVTFQRRQFLQLAAGAAVLPVASRMASAQAYPSRPVRLVIGYTPGGSADLTARLMGQWLSEKLGQSFVIENRPGGGTNIATEQVLRATPDGYTLLLVAPANAINATLYEKLPFDFMKEMEPIAGIIRFPNVVVVHPSLPIKTIPELIAYAKANPGKLNYGSGGNGSSSHLAMELFKSMAEIRMDHIPYKGTGPLITDMLAGQVGLTIASAVPLAPQVRSGKLRGLGVTGPKRSPAFPTIPAIAETVKGYEVINWFGIFAPAGTPKALTARINAVLNEALHAPELVKMLQAQGADAVGGTSEEFERIVRADYAKWGRVVKESGARVD